ncbi:MAG: glycogen synthase GlgA [Acutalibacteraceae bacterium]|nr:glycogen synthase GlgA [Acutalibacteraceae bacterium]
MKVLFAASEAYPFAMSGGLADVAGALPKALRSRFVGCRVVMPLYGTVSEEMRSKMKFITHITVPVAWRRQYCGIFEAHVDGVIYYLLDNQYYFKRDTLYGHYDDAERFAFFSRAVLEIIPYIDFTPDIIHCNDWQTAMIPVYKDRFYHEGIYKDIKTVFTIHNIQYQGKYGYELLGDVLGLSESDSHLVEYESCVNLMKGGIECADRVTTVSRTYAEEILTPWFSHGLDEILKLRQFKLSGIVNGIDVDVYNPETDPLIYEGFSAENLEGKAVNKAKLQEEMGLPVKPDVPVIGIVSRLVSHKGFDLVKRVFEDMLKADIQFAILGSGEWEFETFFYGMKEKYPDKVGLRLGFIPQLAHRIYAGADIFLMPSKSEPCGLAQMVALRYGTIPIVRETGGLKDTIQDSGDGKGNGFTFATYNAHDMLDAVWRSLAGYADREGWEILVKRAMYCDNSWKRSAGEYIKIYKELTE